MTGHRHRRRAPRLSAVLGLGLLLVSGCAATGERTTYHRVVNGIVPARSEPAEPTQRPGPELVAEGYVLIGMVEVEQKVRHCYPMGCRDFDHGAGPTAVARRRAAEQGGDLLRLHSDNRLRVRTVWSEERCKVPEPPSALDRRTDCLEYERVYALGIFRVSEGTVWRKDPELADKRARRMSRMLWGADGAAAAPAAGGEGG